METKNKIPRKKIGFKWYDENPTENSNLPAETEKETETAEQSNTVTIPMSSAQADLVETIKNLYEIIADKSFAKYNDVQRLAFLNQFMNSISLNTELTIKTNLLLL